MTTVFESDVDEMSDVAKMTVTMVVYDVDEMSDVV